MAKSNFNLRGIPAEIMIHLKQEAKRLDTSVNSLVLKIVERGLGFTAERMIYRDLDHLAGSWSAADEKAFTKNTQFFEKIDKELWE